MKRMNQGLRDLIQRLLGHRDARRILAGAAGAAVMLLSLSVYASGGGTGGHNEPHVNWWTWDKHAPPVGWFILDFIIFVGLLAYFLKGPLKGLFEKRHTDIKNAIELAQAAHRKAKAHRDEYKHKIEHVDEEIQGLIEGARSDGKQIRDKVVADAASYAERLRKDTGTAAEQEAQFARARLQLEVVDEVLATADASLTKVLGGEDQQRLLEEAIVAIENGGEQLERFVRHASQPSVGGAP